MSMRTAWKDEDGEKAVTSPLSLIISAFAPVKDVRKTLTPCLDTSSSETSLLLIDLGMSKDRLGGSILAQTYSELGDQVPDLDNPELLRGFFSAIQELMENGHILAYHDRSDGGVFCTLAEMAFAGRCGLDIYVDERAKRIKALFSEELGAVIQIDQRLLEEVKSAFGRYGLSGCVTAVASINQHDQIRLIEGDNVVYQETRASLQELSLIHI